MTKLTFSDGLYLDSKGEPIEPPKDKSLMVVDVVCFVCDNEKEFSKLSANLQLSLSQAAQALASKLDYYE